MLSSSNNILVIKSDKSELKKVEIFLRKLFEENSFSEKNFNRVWLCVSEAVINSIEHGNKNNKLKKVTIEVDCSSNRVSIKIKDEGKGFDIEMLEDPTDDSNILKESGRGIHIIRSLSDSLTYNRKGNSVQLKIECK